MRDYDIPQRLAGDAAAWTSNSHLYSILQERGLVARFKLVPDNISFQEAFDSGCALFLLACCCARYETLLQGCVAVPVEDAVIKMGLFPVGASDFELVRAAGGWFKPGSADVSDKSRGWGTGD